jgi:hypothetical protein
LVGNSSGVSVPLGTILRQYLRQVNGKFQDILRNLLAAFGWVDPVPHRPFLS